VSEPKSLKMTLGTVVSAILVVAGVGLVYSAGHILGSSEGPIFVWGLAIPGISLVCAGVFVFVWVRIRH